MFRNGWKESLNGYWTGLNSKKWMKIRKLTEKSKKQIKSSQKIDKKVLKLQYKWITEGQKMYPKLLRFVLNRIFQIFIKGLAGQFENSVDDSSQVLLSVASVCCQCKGEVKLCRPGVNSPSQLLGS